MLKCQAGLRPRICRISTATTNPSSRRKPIRVARRKVCGAGREGPAIGIRSRRAANDCDRRRRMKQTA